MSCPFCLSNRNKWAKGSSHSPEVSGSWRGQAKEDGHRSRVNGKYWVHANYSNSKTLLKILRKHVFTQTHEHLLKVVFKMMFPLSWLLTTVFLHFPKDYFSNCGYVMSCFKKCHCLTKILPKFQLLVRIVGKWWGRLIGKEPSLGPWWVIKAFPSLIKHQRLSMLKGVHKIKTKVNCKFFTVENGQEIFCESFGQNFPIYSLSVYCQGFCGM